MCCGTFGHVFDQNRWNKKIVRPCLFKSYLDKKRGMVQRVWGSFKLTGWKPCSLEATALKPHNSLVLAAQSSMHISVFCKSAIKMHISNLKLYSLSKHISELFASDSVQFFHLMFSREQGPSVQWLCCGRTSSFSIHSILERICCNISSLHQGRIISEEQQLGYPAKIVHLWS